MQIQLQIPDRIKSNAELYNIQKICHFFRIPTYGLTLHFYFRNSRNLRQ